MPSRPMPSGCKAGDGAAGVCAMALPFSATAARRTAPYSRKQYVMVDYLVQKSFGRRTCLREARAIAERTRASRRDRSSCAFRARTAPRTAIRGRGTIAVLRGPRQRSGKGRVDFDAGLVELVVFEHQPPGIDEGDVGDADEAEDVPDIGGSEIITAAERNAAGRNDDDGLAILQQALGAGLRHPEGAARPHHLVEPCLQARRDREVP